jgi:hypothetical protein
MSNLNLNISLPQNLVLEVLSLINEKDIDLSDYIASQLQAAVQFESLGLDYQEQEALLQQAVYSASAMTVGKSFTVKEIFSEEWGNVTSPRVFGRKFKKVMTKLNIAEVTGKQADNKLIYTRTDKEINMAAYFADGNDIYDDNWNG